MYIIYISYYITISATLWLSVGSQFRAPTHRYRCRTPKTVWQWRAAASASPATGAPRAPISCYSLCHYMMLYVIMLLNDTKCECYQNMSIYVESTSIYIYISFKLWELELWHFANEALRYLQLLRNHTQHFDVDAIEPRSASTTEAKFVFAHMCHNSLLICALHMQTRLDACNRDNYGQCTGSPFGSAASAVFWVTCSSKQHQAPLDAKPVWAWDMGG
jgi:hypothetical protein